MTSSLETQTALPGQTRRALSPTLRDVMLAERAAYETMRVLVPDLALPRERRGPLNARQQEAIAAYQELRDRLEELRSARRSPGLALLDDHSL